jgi:hypothetical protein
MCCEQWNIQIFMSLAQVVLELATLHMDGSQISKAISISIQLFLWWYKWDLVLSTVCWQGDHSTFYINESLGVFTVGAWMACCSWPLPFLPTPRLLDREIVLGYPFYISHIIISQYPISEFIYIYIYHISFIIYIYIYLIWLKYIYIYIYIYMWKI